jgi:imidazolonepropionase-like amidohydrolase
VWADIRNVHDRHTRNQRREFLFWPRLNAESLVGSILGPYGRRGRVPAGLRLLPVFVPQPFLTIVEVDLAYRLPALLHEAGVSFCLSNEGSWQARNLPLQAGQAVGYGLPHDVALRAITLTTAQILGVDGELGSLDVGKRATLFVQDADPIDNFGAPVERMWIDGREVDLNDRQKRLRDKYRQKP